MCTTRIIVRSNTPNYVYTPVLNYDESTNDYRFQFVNESNPSIGWGNSTELLLGNSFGVNRTMHHEYQDYIHKVIYEFESS